MKRFSLAGVVFTVFLAGAVAGWQWGQRQPSAPLPASGQLQDGSWQVYCSPQGGCTNKATNTVRVLAYSFTSQPIADAPIAAHNRKVAVAVILDKGQRTAQYTQASYLAAGRRTPRLRYDRARRYPLRREVLATG